MTAEQLLAVERALLAGVMCDDTWNKALMQLAELAGASYLAVMTRDTSTGQFHVTEPVKLSPRLIEDYEAEFRVLNPMNSRKVLSNDRETYLDWEVLGHRFIAGSPFYQEFMRPHGLDHMMGHRVDTRDGQANYLSIHKLVNESAFDAESAAVVSAAHDALSQTLTLRQRLHGLQQVQAWQRTALDTLSFPIMLVKESGSVLQANRAAEVWLSEPTNPLSAKGMGQDKQTLLTIIRQALGGPGKPPRIASARLSLTTHYAGTSCVAIPLQQQGLLSISRTDTALLMVWPTRTKEPAHALLRQAFGLSMAEARVAELLARGHTPQEIADLRSVETSTIRSHIKAIFRKMHVHRQHDLARLLTELALIDTDQA